MSAVQTTFFYATTHGWSITPSCLRTRITWLKLLIQTCCKRLTLAKKSERRKEVLNSRKYMLSKSTSRFPRLVIDRQLYRVIMSKTRISTVKCNKPHSMTNQFRRSLKLLLHHWIKMHKLLP